MKSNKALSLVIKKNQYISKILQLSKYKSLEKEFSKILAVPSKVLFMENCQTLSRDWNFRDKKFNSFSFQAFLKQTFLYFLLSILNLISFFNIKIKPKNYHILVEGIFSKAEAGMWLELSKYYKKMCLVSNNFYEFKSKKIDNFTYKKKFLINRNDLSLNLKLKILSLLIKIFIFSIIDKKIIFYYLIIFFINI